MESDGTTLHLAHLSEEVATRPDVRDVACPQPAQLWIAGMRPARAVLPGVAGRWAQKNAASGKLAAFFLSCTNLRYSEAGDGVRTHDIQLGKQTGANKRGHAPHPHGRASGC
jgi:hypothetical protein